MSINSIRLSEVKREKQEFILKDFIPMPKYTLTLLSSQGGSGKSFLSLQMACKYIELENKNVGAWYSEDEAPFIKDRFEQLLQSGLVNEIDQKKIRLITDPPPQLARIERGVFVANYEALKDLRMWCVDNEVEFLIIDPLLAFYGGDENNNAQARTFMQPFIEVCKNDKINILFIHHATKPSGDSPSRTRGATAFVDAVRCAYELAYPTVSDKGKEKPDVQKIEQGIRQIKNTKDNRGVRYLLNQSGWEYFATEMRILPKLNRVPKVEILEYDEKIEMTRI